MAPRTCSSASASAVSLPGRISSTSSDLAAASVWRTSMVTTCAPRARACSTCGALVGWLAKLLPQSSTSWAWAARSSGVWVSSGPVSASPKAPRPQQIMVGFQNWLPCRLAKRAMSWALTRVP